MYGPFISQMPFEHRATSVGSSYLTGWPDYWPQVGRKGGREQPQQQLPERLWPGVHSQPRALILLAKRGLDRRTTYHHTTAQQTAAKHWSVSQCLIAQCRSSGQWIFMCCTCVSSDLQGPPLRCRRRRRLQADLLKVLPHRLLQGRVCRLVYWGAARVLQYQSQSNVNGALTFHSCLCSGRLAIVVTWFFHGQGQTFTCEKIPSWYQVVLFKEDTLCQDCGNRQFHPNKFYRPVLLLTSTGMMFCEMYLFLTHFRCLSEYTCHKSKQYLPLRWTMPWVVSWWNVIFLSAAVFAESHHNYGFVFLQTKRSQEKPRPESFRKGYMYCLNRDVSASCHYRNMPCTQDLISMWLNASDLQQSPKATPKGLVSRLQREKRKLCKWAPQKVTGGLSLIVFIKALLFNIVVP